MGGATNRRKGHQAERDVAAWLRSHGFPDAYTTRSKLGHDGTHAPGDVVGPVGLVIEVKHVAQERWKTWCRQAQDEAGDRPWVVVRKTPGSSDVASWESVAATKWGTVLSCPRDYLMPFGAYIDWFVNDEPPTEVPDQEEHDG